MASIREKRRGVWEVRVFTGRDERGRPVQLSATVVGTRRDALRTATRLEAQPPAEGANRTVAESLDAWLDANDGSWAESTRRDQRSRARYVARERIGSVHLARLSVEDVERWHARLRRAGVGDAAIRGRHIALRAALEQAVRWGWVQTNVASHARLRNGKKPPRPGMSADDVHTVLEAARRVEPAAELAFRIAAIAGARRSELAALRWTDVHDGRLTIDSSVFVRRDAARLGHPELLDGPTKTANRRSVSLDAVTLEMIETQRAQRELVSPYMFSINEGPPNPDRIGWWWKRTRELAGVAPTWRLHDLRHWTATMGIAGGHDVRTVAGRLGHADPAMTLRVYAHPVEAADDALAKGLGEALAGGRDERATR